MSRPPIASRSLSDAASAITCRIPELLARIRDLENEETELDTRVHQLVERLPLTKTACSSVLSTPKLATSTLKPRSRATVETDSPATSPQVDSSEHLLFDYEKERKMNTLTGNFETPAKTFLMLESFALAMSIRSKRKGRVLLSGDCTEFGERR